MAAYFIDLDGTALKFHTAEWLPGVVEALTALHTAGHQIHFVTMRDRMRDAGTDWSVEVTEAILARLPFPTTLTTNVDTPRILIDDVRPHAVPAYSNMPERWIKEAVWLGEYTREGR